MSVKFHAFGLAEGGEYWTQIHQQPLTTMIHRCTAFDHAKNKTTVTDVSITVFTIQFALSYHATTRQGLWLFASADYYMGESKHQDCDKYGIW